MRSTSRQGVCAIAFAASLLIGIRSASAQDLLVDCHGDPKVCDTLVRGEQELASMLVSGDVSIVARLFADDAVWSLGDGTRWTKAEAIAALRTMPRMRSSRLLRASVHQHGSVAIVAWHERWHDPASDRDEQSFGTDTWLLRAGRWQIIASQEARPPAIAR